MRPLASRFSQTLAHSQAGGNGPAESLEAPDSQSRPLKMRKNHLSTALSPFITATLTLYDGMRMPSYIRRLQKLRRADLSILAEGNETSGYAFLLRVLGIGNSTWYLRVATKFLKSRERHLSHAAYDSSSRTLTTKTACASLITNV